MSSEIILDARERQASNMFYSDKLKKITSENLDVIINLRDQIQFTFKITVALYVVLFILGILLLSVPVVAAFTGDISIYNSILGGTLGITEIAALLAFRPVERIHDLMGDMSQISMAINSYQQQVALRILQFNSEDRKTIDKAATEIGKATKETMELIQEFVETKEENKSKNNDTNEGQKDKPP